MISTPMSPLARDLAHVLNVHGIDTELDMSDRAIAELLIRQLRDRRELHAGALLATDGEKTAE